MLIIKVANLLDSYHKKSILIQGWQPFTRGTKKRSHTGKGCNPVDEIIILNSADRNVDN